MLGEMAFGNVVQEIADYAGKHRGDNGYDFEIDGVTIDVKTRIYTDPCGVDLLTMKRSADLYVLAVVHPKILRDRRYNTVRLVGYCADEQLEKGDLGHGKAFICKRENLIPLYALPYVGR